MFEQVPPCACRIHRPRDPSADDDESTVTLVADVAGRGYHRVVIPPGPGQRGWVFTVGLWHSVRSPELAIFGLDVDTMADLVDGAARQALAGSPPLPGERRSTAIGGVGGGDGGFALEWRAIHSSWYEDLLGCGTWFYCSWFPAVQMAWLDGDGRGPWEATSAPRCRQDQPAAWRPADEQPLGHWRYGAHGLRWPWPDPPQRQVFISRSLAAAPGGLVMVVHDPEGDWHFLDHGGTDPGAVSLGTLGEVAARLPDANPMSDLPPGWCAHRTGPGGGWTPEPLS